MYAINVPFSGFYDSLYSDMIDSAIEMEAENYHERIKNNPLMVWDYTEAMYDHTDFKACRNDIAATYVHVLNDTLSGELGSKIEIKFLEVKSPRYYNFGTDQIYAEIDEQGLAALFAYSAKDKHKTLENVITDSFSSCDGFISFYSNDVVKWLSKPLLEWDHNELECLLKVVLLQIDASTEPAVYLDLYYDTERHFSLHNFVDWKAYRKDVAKRLRYFRKTKG